MSVFFFFFWKRKILSWEKKVFSWEKKSFFWEKKIFFWERKTIWQRPRLPPRPRPLFAIEAGNFFREIDPEK